MIFPVLWHLNVYLTCIESFIGQIGDWKNYFTVAMNEEFDKWFKEGMENSKLQFQFA